MKWLILISSHLICFAIGYHFFALDKGSPEPSPQTVQKSERIQRQPLPSDLNPLEHATSGDYRELAEQYFEEEWDTVNSERFFRRWVAVDPDGAVRFISGIYHIHGASNMLNNLIGGLESELAPALVEHYGEFEYISHFDLKNMLGRCLAKIAEDDLGRALALARAMPGSRQNLPLDKIIDRLGGPGLDVFFDRITGPDADLIDENDQYFWQRAISRAWRVYSPEKFESLFERFDQPRAVKELTSGLLREVQKFDRSDHFVRIFESLPPSKQELAFERFRESFRSLPHATVEQLKIASQQQGSERLLDTIEKQTKK